MGLALMISSNLMVAQDSYRNEIISIQPHSELIIAGSTNVNKFDCTFDIELISSPIAIAYQRKEDLVKLKDLKLSLRTSGFDCGNKRMNADFQDLLMSHKYPAIEIEVKQLELIAGDYQKAFLQVTMAGKSKQYELPVLVKDDFYKGKLRLNIRDFGLEPPRKALGLIEVNEIIKVQFDLKVAR
jgi:hypothetical protein